MILPEREGFEPPICYALLPSKTENCYNRMTQLVRSAWPALKPKAISTDFKIALMRSMSAAYPDAELQDCFFQLVKNLRKKIGDLQSMPRYKNEPDFALAVRMISAIAFVPPANLDDLLAELAVYLPDELMPVLTYSKNRYIGKLLDLLPDGRIVKKNPLFPVTC